MEHADIFSVSFESLLTLPCYVFWKNKEGTYLGYNNYGAINLGYSSGSEIKGKTDFELFPQDIAELYRENDKIVITEKKQIFIPERGVLKSNFPVVFLTYKMPLYDEYKMIAGVVGIAFTQPVHDVSCPATKNLSISELEKICNHCPQITRLACSILSEKERVCLQYLCQGLTIKMIARQLKISPKTVETYIDRAKVKINCRNKSQLISTFIKMCGCI